MKQKKPKSCFILCCLFCAIFSVILSAPLVNAQSEEVKRIWEKNCALRNKYWNELIFTATQSGDSVSWVAENRTAYIAVFEELLLDGEPAMKSRRDKILKMIKKAPGEHSVIISKKVDREVDILWKDIIKKAQSLGIQCK